MDRFHNIIVFSLIFLAIVIFTLGPMLYIFCKAEMRNYSGNLAAALVMFGGCFGLIIAEFILSGRPVVKPAPSVRIYAYLAIFIALAGGIVCGSAMTIHEQERLRIADHAAQQLRDADEIAQKVRATEAKETADIRALMPFLAEPKWMFDRENYQHRSYAVHVEEQYKLWQKSNPAGTRGDWEKLNERWRVFVEKARYNPYQRTGE